ncbi:MAG: response regulator [Proteobacteria bacterium]|nr:response regulator [Pseudomonadota bacterium]
MPRKILIIDDEPDICAYLAAALEDAGYSACALKEEKPTLASIAREKPDLVILDIMMPGRSGLSIYREMRSAPGLAGVPIILVSGIQNARGLVEAEKKRLDKDPEKGPPEIFVEKPILLPHLLSLVESFLR